MKHIPSEWKRTLRNDRLGFIVEDTRTGVRIRQCKRLPKDFPLPKEVIRAYIHEGGVAAAKLMASIDGTSAMDGWRKIGEHRGPVWGSWTAYPHAPQRRV